MKNICIRKIPLIFNPKKWLWIKIKWKNYDLVWYPTLTKNLKWYLINKYLLILWLLTPELKLSSSQIDTCWCTSVHQCTEVRFVSFLSGGFITAIVVNPPERKLAKCTSVHCPSIAAVTILQSLYSTNRIRKTQIILCQNLIRLLLWIWSRDLREMIESGPLCITDLFQNKSVAYSSPK